MIRTPEDIQITCSNCGFKFFFTKKAQDFFKEKGYPAPKRCKSCRIARKAQQEAEGYAR